MHQLKSIQILITLLLTFSSSLYAHVTLDNPLGGETFIEGQTIVIRWHIVVPHQTLNWDLLFSSNGGTDWEPIQLDLPLDSLTHTWVVPSTFSSQCRIRVIQDNTGTDYYGTSMDFTILPNTSPPILDAPAQDLLMDCDLAQQDMNIQAWLDNHGGAAVTNYCGVLTWTNDYTGLSDGCGATGSAVVVFTATDDCGSTFTVATVVITDHQPPRLDIGPSDIMVACDGLGNTEALQQWLHAHGGAQASDACGTVNWNYEFISSTEGCGDSGSVWVNFSATDECANRTEAMALFSIIDTSPPEILLPARDTILECSATMTADIQSWLNNHGGAWATDACGSVSWSDNFSLPTDTCLTDTMLVSFTATDECGNSAVTQSNLILIDTTSAPVDTTVFAPLGATWYYSGASNGPPWETDPLYGYYFVEKDTILLGRQARVIGWYANHDGIIERVDSLTQYISVTGDQVHYKVGDEFVLLYDFGAVAGDTIRSKVMSSDLSLGCLSSFEEEVIDFSYVIDSVSTVVIDGETLRSQHVTSLQESADGNWGFLSNPLIERIGYFGWGGFWYGQGLGCIFEAGYLRCYEDTEVSWRNPAFGGSLACDYILGTVDQEIASISLYPNPTTGIVYLPEGVEEVEIFSMEGSQVVFERNGKEMDLSDCAKGMYFVRLGLGGKVYVGKVVLQK